MRIAITGGTGFIGSHLAECLSGRGHEVTCLVRDPARAGWLEAAGVRQVRGDLDSPSALAALAAGQDVVVHAAGLTKARTMEEFVRVNVGGTERLLAAVRAHAPRLHRFVYFSSQAAMGPSTAEAPLTEDAPQRPVSNYGKSKSLAEKLLHDGSGSIPVTIIRPPVVFGPREKDVLAYFRLANGGILPYLGGARVLSLVYVANLVRGVTLAIERPLGSFRSYFFTDGPDLPWTALLDMMARAVGKKPLRIRVPMPAAAAAAAVSSAVAGLVGKPALLSLDMVAEMRHPFNTITDQRARTELGYRPFFTTEQGMEQTVQWYRDNRWL
jgi:nucleoside-diphosphate-sugar epimerase